MKSVIMGAAGNHVLMIFSSSLDSLNISLLEVVVSFVGEYCGVE